jgi:hypothetical protein
MDADDQIISAIETYKLEAQEALARAHDLVNNQVHSAVTNSRLENESREYEEFLRLCTIGRPITASEYQDRPGTGATPTFVIASSDQVRHLLKDNVPRLPILVPGSLNGDPQDKLDLDEFKELLMTRKTVQMHDFDVMYRNYKGHPRRVSPAKALARLTGTDQGPINMLSMSVYKPNAIPACLKGLPDYHILQTVTDTRDENSSTMRDLSNGAQFQLLAGKGAFHLPHVDRHGMTTTIFNDYGEKLWPVWSGLQLGEVHKFINGGSRRPGVAIFLKAGDLLIQPPLTVHAPLSLSTVLMTGTMHLHSRGILNTMEQMALEKEYPDITNEGISNELTAKLHIIISLWESGKGPWHWGSRAELAKCKALLRSSQRSERIGKRKQKKRQVTIRKKGRNTARSVTLA